MIDLGTILSIAALCMIGFLFFFPPPWISKALKKLFQESLGSAMLEFFSGVESPPNAEGETFEMSPQETMLLFMRDIAQHAAASAAQVASTDFPIHMACYHSAKTAKAMAEESHVARAWNSIPDGLGGRQSIQRGIKEFQKNIPAMAGVPVDGMAGQLLGIGQGLTKMGVPVGKIVTDKLTAMGAMGEAAPAAPAAVTPAVGGVP